MSREFSQFYILTAKGVSIMISEKSTIRITATYDEGRTHRYTLRRVWDESKKSAVIIMSNSSRASVLQGDLTSLLVQNNLLALGYGAVTCVNLFSLMCQKLDLSGDIEGLTNDENTEQILQAVRDTDICIVAIGTLAKTYKKAAVYQNRLFEHLREYQAKVHTIAAKDGSEGLHPLSAKLREVGSWSLVPFKIPSLPQPLPQDEKTSLSALQGASVTGKRKRQTKADTHVVPLTAT